MSDRPSRTVIFAAAVLVLLLLAAVAALVLNRAPARPDHSPITSADPGRFKAGEFIPAHLAPDFALQGSDGRMVSLKDYRGKVVLLTFGFTYCAAVCPTTLSTLAQARKSLGKQAGDVQVIFVTVDPERDSSAAMQSYLSAFGPGFIGATGRPADLANVRSDYGVTAVKQGTGPDAAFAHTSSIFLIDRSGRLRAMMPFGHEPADFVHDVKILLES